MKLKYYYARWIDFIFLPFGILLLFFGLDHLFLQTRFYGFLINNADKICGDYPKIASVIAIFLGFLVTSGSIINIIRGKNYVLEADDQEITIHTGSINKESSTIKINWNNFIGIETRWVLGVLRWHGGNRGWTKVLVIKTKSGVIEWPSVMIMKNKISFNKKDSHDELIINAWLNKNKKTIINEISNLAQNHSSLS